MRIKEAESLNEFGVGDAAAWAGRQAGKVGNAFLNTAGSAAAGGRLDRAKVFDHVLRDWQHYAAMRRLPATMTNLVAFLSNTYGQDVAQAAQQAMASQGQGGTPQAGAGSPGAGGSVPSGGTPYTARKGTTPTLATSKASDQQFAQQMTQRAGGRDTQYLDRTMAQMRQMAAQPTVNAGQFMGLANELLNYSKDRNDRSSSRVGAFFAALKRDPAMVRKVPQLASLRTDVGNQTPTGGGVTPMMTTLRQEINQPEPNPQQVLATAAQVLAYGRQQGGADYERVKKYLTTLKSMGNLTQKIPGLADIKTESARRKIVELALRLLEAKRPTKQTLREAYAAVFLSEAPAGQTEPVLSGAQLRSLFGHVTDAMINTNRVGGQLTRSVASGAGGQTSAPAYSGGGSGAQPATRTAGQATAPSSAGRGVFDEAVFMKAALANGSSQAQAESWAGQLKQLGADNARPRDMLLLIQKLKTSVPPAIVAGILACFAH